MIKKSFYPLSILGVLLVGLIMVFGSDIAHAASVFLTFQGGTGSSTPSGILYGDNGATTHLNTVVMGANCTFSAGVLNCTGSGGFAYPFTPKTFAGAQVSATSTPIWDTSTNYPALIASSTLADDASTTKGLTSTGSTWLPSISSGLVANDANHLLYGTATGTIQGSGGITVTAGGSVLAAGTITVACATCNLSSASVTSVGSGTGLAGGPITTSGTLSLPTIVGTSSAETAANVPFYTTTSATPALLSGGDSTFTFVSASKKLIMLNATSTNLSATGSFFTSTTGTLNNTNGAGQLAVNTTAASSSLQFGEGTVFATSSASFTWSTTTPSVNATDTIMIMNGPRGVKFDNIACRNVGGAAATTTIAIGTGVATSTYVQGTTNTPTFTTLTTNNSFNSLQTIFIAIGSYSSLGISQVSCGFGKEYTY